MDRSERLEFQEDSTHKHPRAPGCYRRGSFEDQSRASAESYRNYDRLKGLCRRNRKRQIELKVAKHALTSPFYPSARSTGPGQSGLDRNFRKSRRRTFSVCRASRAHSDASLDTKTLSRQSAAGRIIWSRLCCAKRCALQAARYAASTHSSTEKQ